MAGGAVWVGQFLTVGIFLPANTSGKDIIFERFEPAKSLSSRGLEFRYGAIHLPQRTCLVGAGRGWPVPGCGGVMKPVNGFVYRDGEDGAQIVVAARSSKPRSWLIPGFRLHYRIGGKEYEAVYAQGMKSRAVRGSGFFAGTRHIGCEHDEFAGTLRCEISTGLKPAPAVSDCHSGHPQGYLLRRNGSTGFFCGETMILPGGDNVEPGRNWRRRGLRCQVVTVGRLRCRNADGHGFFLSEKRSRRF
jgi:hypothetical protein